MSIAIDGVRIAYGRLNRAAKLDLCARSGPACDEEECAWCDNTLRPPSRWQHYRDGEA